MPLDNCHFLQVADTDGISPQATAVYLNGQSTQAISFNTAAHYVGDSSINGIAFSCPATGSPVGTVKLQVSIDVNANQQRGPQYPDAGLANWADVIVPSSGVATVAISGSTSGPIIWSLKDHPFRWARLVYATSSGTILPTVTIQSKKR